jgi:hypothetical protein
MSERTEPLGSSSATGGLHIKELRRSARTTRVASGSLACPSCDAPVALTDGPVALTDQLGCPFCGHRGPTRAFLSLAVPTRPARVEVHVRMPRVELERSPRRAR